MKSTGLRHQCFTR